MANLCIKTPSSAIQVLIFQLLVLRPRPNVHGNNVGIEEDHDRERGVFKLLKPFCKQSNKQNWH